ncbi:MAG: acyl-CoA/acyl-ACP dehydrogenase [Pseudonocardia sp.]|nr:acyl-CoA/acyl-ACP dehydrogenase [Pseudonocardia sp.]MBO0872604.1 acyl-CoA/acyl-ACP dehydrogenase [Pseudonocardia sp.]
MDLTLTEDQELIQRTARELLAARAATAGVRALADDPSGYSTALWKEIVELGWTGMAIPEEHGGVGVGFLEACLLIEEMGAARVPGPYLATVACCAQPIAAFGTDRQRAHWLAEIARGRVLSYAPPGRHGGWGADGTPVSAAAGGGGFTLNGTAEFVPYARSAEDILLVANGPGDGELTAFLVDARSPGITHRSLEVIGPERPAHLGLSGVSVSDDRVIGGVGQGSAVAESINAFGAAATAAEMVGGAQRVLDMTVEYAKTREQFGRPIGGFQAVQHHCADMAIDVLGARFIGYEAIWRLAQGDRDADAPLSVALAKAWTSEAYQRVCALGQQVHGAIGFTAEHDMQLYLRHAMSTALAFGDGDFHTDTVADRIGLPQLGPA